MLPSLNWLDDEAKCRVKKNRIYVQAKPARIVRVMAYVYWCTVWSHLWRGGLCGYLTLCTPLAWLAPSVGVSVFVLSSLQTIGQTLAGYWQAKRLASIARAYGHWFDVVYGKLSVLLLVVAGMACAIQLGQYLHVGARLVDALHVGARLAEWLPFLFLGSIRTRDASEFRENLRCGTAVKIEENATLYRITIGELSWETAKDNLFNRMVFAMLIYTAIPANGKKFIAHTPEIAAALGWETPRQLHYLYEKYRKTGNWSSVFAHGISIYLDKIKALALKEYGHDLELSVTEVRQRLFAKGYHFSEGKIVEALSVVDFNTLRPRLHERYQRRTRPDRSAGLDAVVQIELGAERHCVRAGDWYWQIAADDRFGWISLLKLLTKARNVNGDLRAPGDEIYGLAGFNSKQRLRQVLEQYDALAEHYRAFRNIGPKYWQNRRLQEQILEMWLPDLTVNSKDMARRLVESGVTDHLSAETVRRHVRCVDFMAIKKTLCRYYQKSKYRKASKYLIARYQEIIGEMAAALQRGENWPKARIDKFMADVPLPSGQNHLLPPKTTPPYSTAAWLKCFLFNLPKSLDGKICCPNCGSFDTAPKSKIPQAQVAPVPKTGKSEAVQTFRFYCKNPDCGLQSFTATPDGSHIMQEARYAQACFMLRLVMTLRGSYHAVAQLLGVSKSTVFDQLTLISEMATHWHEILGQVRFSGTLCIDEKYVKIAALRKTKGNRPFAYLFFAVAPFTYDLLHIEIYPTRDNDAIVAFLTALKAKNIYPETIMTDLLSGYSSAIKQVYGRSVTICKCHFHFLQNIYKHMNDQFGKKDVPEIAETLQQEIFDVVNANAKKTIRKRHQELLQKKEQYLAQEPKLLPMFNCLDSYIPHLLRVVENERVWISTNNACELVIRHFNQRYKLMDGFDTLDTARRHASLFQIVHRFTPLTDDAQDANKRGRAPLQLAGYRIEHMPIFQYLTAPLLFNTDPAQTLAKWRSLAA